MVIFTCLTRIYRLLVACSLLRKVCGWHAWHGPRRPACPRRPECPQRPERSRRPGCPRRPECPWRPERPRRPECRAMREKPSASVRSLDHWLSNNWGSQRWRLQEATETGSDVRIVKAWAWARHCVWCEMTALARPGRSPCGRPVQSGASSAPESLAASFVLSTRL